MKKKKNFSLKVVSEKNYREILRIIKYVTSKLVVNFTNILRVAFATIFLHQKITNPNCKYRKAAQNTRKMLVKLTLDLSSASFILSCELVEFLFIVENI